jgi:hypothetical protein
MFVDPYWNLFEPVEYIWHLIQIPVWFLLFLAGTTMNFGVIFYYLKQEIFIKH